MKALPIAIAILALPVAAHAGAWGGIFSFVDVTSDYRFQGVSNSDGNAAVQGNVHYWRPDGYYAGIFASQVDFKDPGHTSYEIDYYAGKNFRLANGTTELKLQGMYSVFPDNRTFGPTYDFATGEVAVSHIAGKLTTHALAAFVPEGSYRSGKVWRVESEADYALRQNLSLRAVLGDQWGGRGHTRVYWSLGATATWKRLGFELRYVDTDRTRENCGFRPKACDPAIVGTLTVNLPSIL